MFMPQAGLPYWINTRLRRVSICPRGIACGGLPGAVGACAARGGGLNETTHRAHKQKAQLRGHDQLLPENDRLGWPLTLHGQESVEYYQLYV